MNVKALINQIKMNKKYKGVKPESRNFNHSDANEKGFILDKNPCLLVNNKIAFAGMQIMETYNMFTNTTTCTPIISIDDNFELLSDNTKEFVIQHEMGHFNNHKEFMVGVIGRRIELEYEADIYAALRIGKHNTIKALKELRGMGILSIELNKRINHVRNMQGLK